MPKGHQQRSSLISWVSLRTSRVPFVGRDCGDRKAVRFHRTGNEWRASEWEAGGGLTESDARQESTPSLCSVPAHRSHPDVEEANEP